MACVCSEYRKRYSQRNLEGTERGQPRYSRNYSNSSSGSDEMESGNYDLERRQSDEETRYIRIYCSVCACLSDELY